MQKWYATPAIGDMQHRQGKPMKVVKRGMPALVDTGRRNANSLLEDCQITHTKISGDYSYLNKNAEIPSCIFIDRRI
jgi:hypothetical protein